MLDTSVEDSIIRGTTSRNRVRRLRESGIKELHMAVRCPPTCYSCASGIDFSSRGEFIAAEKFEEDIAQFIGLDSLHYLSVDGMVEAPGPGQEDFCLACYTGQHPPAARLHGKALLREAVRK